MSSFSPLPDSNPLDRPEKPEEKILRFRFLLREMSSIQDLYEDRLEKELPYALSETGKILLHDYIYNSTEEEGAITFEEYASYLGRSQRDLFENKKNEPL